jgi:hypothetical protein
MYLYKNYQFYPLATKKGRGEALADILKNKLLMSEKNYVCVPRCLFISFYNI